MHSLSRRAAPEQENAVWRRLYERQLPAMQLGMCPAFLTGLELCRFDPARLPRHAPLSRHLHDVCGWRIETVPGLIPAREFFALVRQRRFPSSEWIRHPDELEYTSAPDAFHDLVGHLPQLCSSEFAPLLESLAWAALGANDALLDQIERLYWYTIEFGLVREHGRLLAYGAGLASSINELGRALEDEKIERASFDAERARLRSFESDHQQTLYFVCDSLPKLATTLRTQLTSDRCKREAG